MKFISRQKSRIARSKITYAKSGFTIIELMFAMTFVATLLIAISVVTVNIISIYQKGLALKAVSSVGRSLIEEITTTINEAPVVDTTSLCNHLVTIPSLGSAPNNYASINACKDNQAYKYVFNDRYDATNDVQYSGVFCTGKYSYLWNTQPAIINEPTQTLTLKYRNAATNTDTQAGFYNSADPKKSEIPRFIRIEDTSHRVCTAFIETQNDPILSANPNWELNITHEVNSAIVNKIPAPTEGYLTAFDLDLFLYEFTIQPIAQDAISLRTFMTGNFILATDTGGVDIMTNGNYCKNQYRDDSGNMVDSTSSLGNLGAGFNYCAINKFNFAARTAGV